MAFLKIPKSFATTAIHAGQDSDQWDSKCIVTPLVMSTSFKQFGPGEETNGKKKYEYGRTGNPTRDTLEICLAEIEGAKYAVSYSSCVGALTALIGTLEKDDHVIIGQHLDSGMSNVWTEIATRFGIKISQVDFTDIENVKKEIIESTKLIWTEVPTSPTLEVFDIQALADIANANNVLLAIDNTYLTCYFQRPLDHGAHFCAYSLTKFMNGHNDVMMGAILTNSKEYYEKLRFMQNAMGIVPSPFNCSLLLRSLKTLAIRMKQHFSNCTAITRYLENHPKIIKVLNPASENHPQHELFKKQASGHSGMIGFYIKGDINDAKTFLKCLKLITIAPSLGGMETIASLPVLMGNKKTSEADKLVMNITDNFIRFSTGLEDVDDLIEDLKQALDSI